MHKDNLTCGDLSKGPNLRVENEAQVAGEQGSNGCSHSIDEVADEEMEVDDDEGAGNARAEPRADEPGDDPPPRPREVRPSPLRPGAEAVRQHNLTLSISELVLGMCGITRKERPLSPGSATTNGR